jgi:hypothetical protein
MLRASRPSISVKNKKKSSGLFVIVGLKPKRLNDKSKEIARETSKKKELTQL